MSDTRQDYLALLRGEIEPEEYVDRVKIAVDARMIQRKRREGKPIAFSWPRWPGRKS